MSLFPPTLMFYFEARYTNGTIDAEAKLQSRLVSQIIGQNPQFWQYETLRLTEMVQPDATNERITIFDVNGGEVTQVGPDELSRPHVTVSRPLYDAGIQVGEIHIVASMFEALKLSFVTLLISSFAGLGAFFALRTLPLRLLRETSDRASFLASHDPLTNLPNRALFDEWLKRSIDEADRHAGSVALLCLDLDHFKEVNDILGHDAGDELLRQVTKRMQTTLRETDVVARLGGDEFAILQNNIAQPGGSSALAERLITSISKPYMLDGNKVVVGVSIGISIRDHEDEADAQMMMRHADLALYRAKDDGRGTHRFFEDHMNDALAVRKTLENNLRTAIAEGAFELHYQPQIDLTTNTITGVEALLRWNHNNEGYIAPDQFIPVAEDAGLIIPIGTWVIREACRQANDWPGLTFAVNVSPVQFRDGDLAQIVRDALQAEGVAPSRLEIEITEGVLLNHTEETIKILAELQEMGVRIVMDDFGTGFSSLSYLRRFPFDKIKIDMSFTSDLGTRPDADNIVGAVVKLAATMGMKSNAEGVETKEQAAILKRLGCQEVQGYLYSRPIESASICDLLANWYKKHPEGQSQKHQNKASTRQA